MSPISSSGPLESCVHVGKGCAVGQFSSSIHGAVLHLCTPWFCRPHDETSKEVKMLGPSNFCAELLLGS